MSAQMSETSSHNLNRWTKILKLSSVKDRLLVSVTLLLSIINALLEILASGGIIIMIKSVLNPEEVFNNPWIYPILNLFNVKNNIHLGLVVCAVVFCLYLTKNIIFLTCSIMQIFLAARYRNIISERLTKHYLTRPLIQHLRENQSKLMHVINIDTEDFVLLGLLPGITILTEMLVVISMSAFTFIMYPFHSLFLITFMGAIPILIYYFSIRKISKKIGDAHIDSRHELQVLASNTFGSIKEIKTYQKEQYFMRLINSGVKKSSNLRAKEITVMKVLPPFIEMLVITVIILVMISNIAYNTKINENFPMYSFFAVVGLRLLPSIFRISNSLHHISFSKKAVNYILNTVDELRGFNNSFVIPETKNRNSNFQSLILNNVSFSYNIKKQTVLDNVSVSFRKGEIVAIAGSSGAGKSTLADIILGLLKPDSGEILQHDSMSKIIKSKNIVYSYVPQNIFVLNDSIRKNIAFGYIEEEIDDDRLNQVIEEVFLKETLQKLDYNLDQILGERGIGLSGGQLQRVALARALYNKPDVLVLDEATSSLDLRTEQDILNTLNSYKNRMACIVIAHRLGSLQNSDRIYYMEEGKIICEGTFESLQETCLGFKSLINLMKN